MIRLQEKAPQASEKLLDIFTRTNNQAFQEFNMDQCLRMALWMVVLIGCLQANPMTIQIFNRLSKDVKCGPHVNFTSPTDVQDHCYEAALRKIKEELNSIKTKCIKPHPIRIDMAKKALKAYQMSVPVPTNSSDCNWDNEGSQKQFNHFVEDIKELCEQLNTFVAQG